ncbi:unnamed protein product [Symbiodinium microadriaticum]|nr:unnamed protein product [Symbiodinium microadriaticum]
MLESMVINVVALIIAAIIVITLFPFFNDFIGRTLSYTWPTDAKFWFGLIFFLSTGIFLSGFYPALVLARFKPVSVLKGKFSGSSGGNLLRKGLVTVQFLASIILITGTFIVYRQMNFLQDQDLGVNIEQTLVIETPNYSSDSVYVTKDNIFRNKLESESSIEATTITTAVPGRTPGWNAGGIRLINQTEAESNQYRVMGGDDGFVDFFGLEILAGRSFDKSFGTEEENVIFNEAAAKRMGFADIDEIINKKIYFWGDTFNVIGVVKNYRQESPKQAYDALIFRYFNSASGFYSVKLNTQNMRQSVDQIQSHWEETFGTKQFNYFFLDDYYNEQYKAELKFGSIFGIFSGLAIMVIKLKGMSRSRRRAFIELDFFPFLSIKGPEII